MILPLFNQWWLILCLAMPGAKEEIQDSAARFPSGGKVVKTELFAPKAQGKFPAIIMLHGADGLPKKHAPAFRAHAQTLARHGFVVLIIYYFDRTETRLEEGKLLNLPTILKHFQSWMGCVGDAVSFAGTLPNVDAKRIGLVGSSLGAFLALAQATQDQRICAIVEYSGGLPEIFAGNVKRMPPVLILHGLADSIVPIKEAEKLEAFLQKKMCHYEIKKYEGQDHVFTGDAAKDAASRCLYFFRKHLKSPLMIDEK